MKKRILSLLLCGCIVVLSGCSLIKMNEAKKDLEDISKDFQEGNTDIDDMEEALNDYTDSISGNVQGFDDINKYIETVKESDAFQQSVQSTTDNGMSLSLEADGNNLVYKYTYTIPVVENAAELIDQSFQSNDSAFEASAKAIRVEAPCVEKVVWEYYTSDGQLITSFTK